MCPGGTSWVENPGDLPSRGSDESADADAGGSTTDDTASGPISDEDRAPNYPPAEVVLSIAMDDEPYVVSDGGLPDWLLAAGMARILDTMRQAEQSDAWEVSTNTEEDE